MPLFYEVIGRRINVTAVGRVTAKDFQDHLLTRCRDPRIHEDMCELLDATHAEQFELSRSDIAALVHCQREHASLFLPIPLAIVTHDPIVVFTSTFPTLTGSADRMIRVFPSRSQAEGWLRALQVVARKSRPDGWGHHDGAWRTTSSPRDGEWVRLARDEAHARLSRLATEHTNKEALQ